jgi:hypothetical protein
VGKLAGKRPLRRPRHRFGQDSCRSGQGKVTGCYESGNEPSRPIKCGNFLIEKLLAAKRILPHEFTT